MSVTYCGNVHPASDLDGWLRAVDEFARPVATARRRAGHEFGLGAWWNADIAATLASDDTARERVTEFLAERDLEIWTLNVFPYGDFHGERVKTDVYSPDWSTEERVLYTRNAAEAAALWSPAGAVVPLSTLPLGYGERDRRVLARNLVRAASHLADLSERSGRDLVLALEPEPFCLCETVAATAAFLEEWVFRPGAWTVSEATLRRHLGVCIDLCHLAVVGEDPAEAAADLDARGVRWPKVQVSACFELRDATRLDELLAFDEPRYLHQTVAGHLRALDLPEVALRRDEFMAARGPIRTHFHVPVFWDDPGALGSTRRAVATALPRLAAGGALLEVETYTWSVLDESWGTLTDGLQKELEFVDSLVPP